MSHKDQHRTTSGLGPGNISYHDILYMVQKSLLGVWRKSKPRHCKRDPRPIAAHVCDASAGRSVSKEFFTLATNSATRCDRWLSTGAAASHQPAWSRSAACHRALIRKRGGGRRGPTGAFVAPLVTRQLYNLAGSGVHDVDVVVVVGASPTESQELAVGSPRGVDDVALV